MDRRGALRPELPEGAEKSLRANFLFREQPAEVAEELENLCEWYWCPAGEKIFDRDDTDAEVFFLVDGLARVVDHAQSGQEVAFSDLEAGTIFGELSAIDNAERSATVYTVNDSVLAVVPADAFVAYLKRQPEIMLRLMQHFVNSIRQLNMRVVGLSSLSGVQRVYGELLHMAEPDPAGGGRWLIQQMPQHKEIAVWAGTTPETVARAIGQLLKAEVVKRRHKTLHILDRHRLQELTTAP